MSRLYCIISSSAVAIALSLCTGCVVDATPAGEIDADTASLEDEVARWDDQPSDEVELDAVVGDEMSIHDQQGLRGTEVMLGDDRGGPDPTPWKVDGEDSDDGVTAGPDPTPWYDDDDDFENAAAMGPDPTPWTPTGARDDDQPWLHETDEDNEPDPQPWASQRTSDSGGSSND